jgi:hypothetical protein
LPTRVGHAEWGDNRFRGYSVARELAGHESASGFLALAISGRRLTENERSMLDDVVSVLTAADPRIWQFKLIRLVSAYGGCSPGVAALTISLEDASIGHHVTGSAAEMLLRLRDEASLGGDDAAEVDDAVLEQRCRQMFADNGRPSGFWVPFRPRDERVDLLAERVAALERHRLPYWRLFEKVADMFWRIGSVRPNIPAALAAVSLDMGFTPAQIGPLMTALGAPAFWANAFEGAAQAPRCLQALPRDNVRYVGPAPRLSPRAGRATAK